MAGPFEGKVALITGSSRGIGKATALELARGGADIAVCARSETTTDDFPGTIGETVELIRALGRKAIGIKMDVSKDEDLTNAVERTMTEFGHIDILINNAVLYVGGDGGFLASDIDILTRSFHTNVRGPYLLSQLVATEMEKTGGGTIIHVSSGSAVHPPPPENMDMPKTNNPFGGPPSSPIYGITKAGLERLGTGMAMELAPKNISVFSVRPPFTISERIAYRYTSVNQPVPKGDTPETTAKAITFLAKDPIAHTGRIFTSQEVAKENNL